MSFDVLQDQIKAKKNPAAVCLGAGLDDIPPHILKKHLAQHGETLEAAAGAALEFHQGLIDALADIVPAVDFQCAWFEALGWRGMKVLEELIACARERNLFVIANAKRGDIDGSSAAYSTAWLGEAQVGKTACPVFSADCVTLSGYMGSDMVKPFLADCAERGKCAFVLVKTSNPSSAEFQDLVSGDRLAYTAMGDLVQRWSRDTTGKYGYQALGAVVGSTQPNVLKQLRRRLDKTFSWSPAGRRSTNPLPMCAGPLMNWAGAPLSATPAPACALGSRRAGTARITGTPPGPQQSSSGMDCAGLLLFFRGVLYDYDLSHSPRPGRGKFPPPLPQLAQRPADPEGPRRGQSPRKTVRGHPL